MGLISSVLDIFGKGPAAAMKKANKQAMAAETKGYNEAKGYFQPYQDAGTQSLGAYKDAIGLGGAAGTDRARAAFENSLFYRSTHDAALKAGQEGVMNAGYGAGTARSGQTYAALADRARQDTNNSFQSYVNPLAGFTDAGLATAGNLGNLATGHAANQSQGYLNKGQIKANKIAGFDGLLEDAVAIGTKFATGGMSGGFESIKNPYKPLY